MRTRYLIWVTVRQRLFWSVACGFASYDALSNPYRGPVLITIGVIAALLCVMAFIAAMQLLFLKIRLVFWHG